MSYRSHITLFLTVLMVIGCSPARHLDEEEYLYRDTRLKIETSENVSQGPQKRHLIDVTAPEPNSRIFGMFPVKLWLYNMAGNDVPDKGFRHWLKYKAGEPPVIYKPYHEEATKSELKAALQNRGFFYYEIEALRNERNKKVSLVYNIRVEAPYRIDTVVFPEATDSLTTSIREQREASLVREGKVYRLQTLEDERERIARELRKDGFFYFSPEYLLFELDTARRDRLMEISVRVKEDVPEGAREKYTIGKIFMHHGHSYGDTIPAGDTLSDGGILHLTDENIHVRTDVLDRMVFFDEGTFYDQEDYEATLSKLTGLGVFKYVNIGMKQDPNREDPVLDVHIYLTRFLPESLQASVQAVSKSNDFIGPGVSLTYLNRNTFRGGELFQLSLHSAFETQFSRSRKGVNSFEIGVRSSVNIPRLVFPFLDTDRLISKRFSPETRISAGYNFFNRTDYFTAHTYDFSFGYHWQETTTKSHDLYVLSVDYLNLNDVDESIDEDYLLRRNLSEDFIVSLRYQYTINNLMYSGKRFNTYFKASAEFAGNALALSDRIFGKQAVEREGPSRFLGLAYAQYARFFTDIRGYFNISRKNRLVGRVYTGLGLPYGNSDQLPYQKQFFMGGTNSVRAFASRSLGPGTYSRPDSLDNNLYLEQSGDIRIETNLEYRFHITKMFKGALFADAGNVWLLEEDEQTPGGAFEFSQVLNQFAVGTGAGIRLDASFLVVRLDVAFPVRKPSLSEGNRWVFKDIDFGSREWRRENLVFNLAIGYPF